MKSLQLLFYALLFTFSLSAQSKKIQHSDTIPFSSDIEAVTDTIHDLSIFGDDTPMNMELKYDITSFIKNKMDGEYLDAELLLEYNNFTTTKNIRLKARGKNRRETCFFPPIYLNFKTDPIKRSELEGFKKIKLVTHCATSKTYTSYLLREYLVYKLYNVFTDNSFRVKLLNIKYTDSGKKKRNYKRYGILIEPIELLSKRTGTIEVDGKLVRGANIIHEEGNLVAFFQYMIGNLDWRIKGGHNVKFIKSATALTQQVTPVPYDFDYSGFVDTHYSRPQSWSSTDGIREREYLGYCQENDEAYYKTINLFLEKKDEILETINSFTYLSKKERKGLINYVEGFYAMLEKPKNLLPNIKSQCRSLEF